MVEVDDTAGVTPAGPRAPRPANEAARLRTLESYKVLDTGRDARFEALAAEVASFCGAPIATIAFLDESRQWFKATVGLDLAETDRDIALCAHTILDPDDVMVIEDTTKDPRFVDNPLVLGDPRLMAYAGAPMVAPDGTVLGTVCAMDVEPRGYTADQVANLRRVAARVVDLLETTSSAERVVETLEAPPEGAAEVLTTEVTADADVRSADRVLELTRPLIESIGEDVEVVTVLERFCREVLDAFGWWAARVAWVQGHALVSESWSVAASAPPVLERLAASPGPVSELEDLAVRYPEAAVQDIGMLRWLADRDVVSAVGARHAVVLDVPVANALGARLIFLLPTSRGLSRSATRTLATAAAILPRVIAHDRTRRELTYRATHDMLTGLLNREGMLERYRGTTAGPNVQRAVLYVDLDGFKRVNDELGHRAGDEVLVHVARQLSGRIRPTDTAVRLGGDEFLVVLDGITDEEEALRVARRLLRALCGPFAIFRTQRVDVAVSIGVAMWNSGTSLHEAIDAADALMYAAKELGGAAIAADGAEGRRLIGPGDAEGRDLDAVLAGAVHVRLTSIVDGAGAVRGLRAELDVEVRHPSVGDLAHLVLESVAGGPAMERGGRGELVLVPGPSMWATDGLVLRLVVTVAASLPDVPIRIVLRADGDPDSIVDQAVLIRDAMRVGLIVGGFGTSVCALGLVDRVDPCGIELAPEAVTEGSGDDPSSVQVAVMAVAARNGLTVYAPTATVDDARALVAEGVEVLVVDLGSVTEYRREGSRRSNDPIAGQPEGSRAQGGSDDRGE